jgi:hypothetical protein
VNYDPAELRAGYTHNHLGKLSYAGALRTADSRPPVWSCPHDHLVPVAAKRCAEAELDRRREGAKQVLTLLHCEEDGLWYDPRVGPDVNWRPGMCPRCGVPMLREKVLIIEAVDARHDPDANLTWVN